jgi:tetratricopeptide (TPR) repeat protein
MLSAMGRHQEAISEIQQARELDPRSVILCASAGWTLLHAGMYDRAIEELARALAMDSLSAPAHSGLGEIYELTGNDEEALSHYLRVVSLTGGSFSTLRGTVAGAEERLRNAYRQGGWKGYWTEQLALLSGNEGAASAYHVASIYARLGKADEAFHWLREAVTTRSTYLLFVNVDPVVRPLKGDPRFASILQTVGLSPPQGILPEGL